LDWRGEVNGARGGGPRPSEFIAIASRPAHAPAVAGRRQSALDLGVEAAHGDLDVDDVFGPQTGHGGRADVVDAQGQLAERLAQAGGDGPELGRPGRVVGDDGDHGKHCSRKARSRQ